VPLHEAVVSVVLWGERTGVLEGKLGLEPQDLPFLDLYKRHATWVDPQPFDVSVSHDSNDDWVVASALAGDAAVIVTGDEDLLSLGSFQKIEIITPRQFLERQEGGIDAD